MKKIKMGVIGLGMAWEHLHAPAYARLGDKFEIKAVCDRDISRAKAAAAWMNIPLEYAYNDYNDMLKNADIEAADVMVPIRENDDCAAAVVKSGKHLLAEKPLAASPDSARELIKLIKKNKVKAMVAENFRYDEENMLIKNLIIAAKETISVKDNIKPARGLKLAI